MNFHSASSRTPQASDTCLFQSSMLGTLKKHYYYHYHQGLPRPSTQRAFHVPVLTGIIPRLAAASFGSCRNLAVGRVPRPQYHHRPTTPAHRNNTFSLDSPILLLIHALASARPLRPAPKRPHPSPRLLAHSGLLPHPRLLQCTLAPSRAHSRLRGGRLTQRASRLRR